MTISIDSAGLTALNRLLVERQKILHESARDSVVATAIAALESVRAATRNATARRGRTKPRIVATGLYGGFTGGTSPRHCFRTAVGRAGSRVAGKFRRVKWLTGKDVKPADRHVFEVYPEHATISPYYVVAISAAEAKAFEQKAAAHRIDRHGALARNALGTAMAKLSTRNVAADGSSTCRAAASRLSTVQEWLAGEDSFGVRVASELEYATNALRGGENALETALQSAANKIAGRLQHVAKSDLEGRIATPFPDVRRRK